MRNVNFDHSHQPSDMELRPGASSGVGFLETGQTLEQVLRRDRAALAILDYSAQEVADLLGYITEKANQGGAFEYKAPNGRVWIVTGTTYRGSQECPWRDSVDHSHSSGALTMKITEKNAPAGARSILIPGLMRHLIEKHTFFEGGFYRLAPETIVEMFGIEKIPNSIAAAKALSL